MLTYKNFLFDLDGTLIDSSPDIIDGVNYTRSKFNLPPTTDAEVMANVGKGLRYLLQQVLPQDFTEEDVSKAYQIQKEYYEVKHVLAKPYEGTIETLKQLKTEGAKLFIVTNKPEKASFEVLKALDMLEYFDAVFGADSLKEHKPSAFPVNHIMDTFQLNKEDSLFIGDSITDYETSVNAKLDFAFVTYGYESQQIQGTYTLNTIKDILEIK